MSNWLSILGWAAVSTLSLSSVVVAQDSSVDRLQALTDQMIETCGSPGGAIGYWDLTSNQIEVRYGGARALNNDHGVARDDLWHIGSNVKAMTTTAMARLVDRGLLQWSDTLAEAFTPYGYAVHPQFADVTLQQILNHRGGFPATLAGRDMNQFVGTDAQRDERADREVFVRLALAAEPGEIGEDVYSNVGYVVIGHLLELISDQSYEELMITEVFAPLGMESPGWGPPQGDQPQGHVVRFLRGPKPMGQDEDADNPAVLNSAGRLHLTVEDHMRFLIAHVMEDQGEMRDFLSPQTWMKLHIPQADHDYVMGWGLFDGRLAHGGSNSGWYQQVGLDLTEKRAVLAVVNYGHGARCGRATGEVLIDLLEIELD